MIQPDTVTTKLRLLQISTALIYALLSVGICFGFAALKPILIDSGVYSYLCHKDDTLPCVDQEVRLNQMFTWAAVATNVSSFPIGLLLDRYGPRVTSIIGASLMVLGTIGMSVASATLDIYIISYAVLAMSGSFLLLASFSLANAFPSRAGLIVSGLTGAFDASSGIFLLYRLWYQRISIISVPSFFRAYLVVPFAILIVQVWYMPSEAYIGEPLRRESFSGEIAVPTALAVDYARRESQSAETAILPDLDERSPFLPKRYTMTIDPVIGQMHHITIRGILISGWFIFPALVMITSLIRVNFYISTVWAQVNFLLGRSVADSLMNFFDILLPVGGLCAIPAIGYILDNYMTIPVYAMTLALSLVSGMLSFVPQYHTQVIHFLTFVVLRPWIYSILPGTVIKIFGSDRFGGIYGGIMAIAGLVNLFAHPLEIVTYDRLNGDFRYVDLGLVTASVVSIAGTVLYMKLKVRYE